jgi:hypothetical protein
MAVLVVGIALVVMGLFAAAMLVLAPLGLVALSAGPVLWVLFPLFTLVGFVLCAANARTALRPLTLGASWMLLALALGAAAGLLLEGVGVVHPAANTLPLWYVLGVAGLLGAAGASAFARRAPSA